MRWIYLSPHFDDVVLSCGGLVVEQRRAGDAVAVWTVCAGQPNPDQALSPFAGTLHARWQTGPEAVLLRRAEDENALARLDAQTRYWNLPDCIYRRLPGGGWLVNGEDDLWQPLHPLEQPVVDQLTAWIEAGLKPGDRLVCPLTLGNHVDHHLVRAAAEAAGQPLVYYPDYPYAVREGVNLAEKTGPGWQRNCQPVGSAALAAWQDAIAAYTSQISTFWGGLEEMRAAIAQYAAASGGACLYWPAPAAVD